MSLLAVHDLRVTYGEVVTLVGANGAGKSTLLKALMGVVAIESGDITFRGERTNGLRAHEMARRGIAYVPEGRGTLRQLSVRENLVLGAFGRPAAGDIERDLRDVL